jgi:hypothetical protein
MSTSGVVLIAGGRSLLTDVIATDAYVAAKLEQFRLSNYFVHSEQRAVYFLTRSKPDL